MKNLSAKTFQLTLWLVVALYLPDLAYGNMLAEKYQQIKPRLQNNVYGLPIYIESFSERDSQQGDIYGVIPQPYARIRRTLTSPASWCDIVSLHLNIKACTFRRLNGHCELTLYSGRKFYQPPEDSYKLVYVYSLAEQEAGYFQIKLDGTDGPLGTYNHHILVDAMVLDDNSTFIHFSYHYKQGFFARFAMQTYLSTLGKDKIGFTVTGQDENSQPNYIDGIRGVIERNVIRYYFAIKSYLDTLAVDNSLQPQARLRDWFALTERYPKQLHEMELDDYLRYKQQEHQNQLSMQLGINADPTQCMPEYLEIDESNLFE